MLDSVNMLYDAGDVDQTLGHQVVSPHYFPVFYDFSPVVIARVQSNLFVVQN